MAIPRIRPPGLPPSLPPPAAFTPELAINDATALFLMALACAAIAATVALVVSRSRSREALTEGEEIHRQLGRHVQRAEVAARAEGLAQEAARLHALEMMERCLPGVIPARDTGAPAKETQRVAGDGPG